MAKITLQEEASAPATPGTGKWQLYLKSDGLYIKDDAGVETGPFHVTIQASAVLGSIFTITGTAGTYQDSGLSVTLPSAGTYKISVNIRSQLVGNAGTSWWIKAKLYNSTDAADVTDSERMVIVTTATTRIGTTSSIDVIVTITASKTIKLYVARDGASSPSWTESVIGSDTAGKTVMMYEKIG